MFRFFRQLRHKLLTKNRLGRYLLYAIGEIFLVVIGILIALQVNNWNSERSEEKELHEYLVTIAQNIKSDLSVIQKLKNQQDSVKAYVQRYWPLAHKEFYEVGDAGLLTQIILASFEVENFNCNQTGFESLKTSGLIGKIQGTETAESIFEYYRRAGIINNLVYRANTYSQAMQIELMQQEIASEWVMINGRIGWHLSGKVVMDPEYWKESQNTLKKVYRHPTVYALMARNGSNRDLLESYEEINLLGLKINSDIEHFLKQ